MIACSACQSALGPGMTSCPNCHLPLTAYAVPVYKKQMSTLSIVFLILLGIGVVSVIIGLGVQRRAAQARAAATDKVLQEIQSGHISDGPTFTQHCGHPDHVTKMGSDLSFAYIEPRVSVLFTRKHPKDLMDLSSDISFWSITNAGRTIDPHEAITALNCSI